MKPGVDAWVEKAEGDFRVACRELRVRVNPNFDAVCFHAQQCAEKYIKSRLHETGMLVPKVHDLLYLLDLSVRFEPDWAQLADDMRILNSYAVDIRYPDVWADKAQAREACESCQKIRQLVRASPALGL